jgi:hypothetical protein
MLGLSHVVLHVGFCGAIARASSNATVALRVRVSDRIGRRQLDKVFRVQRGDDPSAVLEFDSSFGIYRLDVEAPKFGCAATDYLFFIEGHDRSVTETLGERLAPPQPVLLSGTAPQSFLYVQPTFVLFDKRAVACNKPLPDPLVSHIVVENEQLALRLRTPTHQYHYVRIPIPFPIPWSGWPSSIQFNVTQEMVDALAGDPVNTLLCPKLWRTSAG